VIPRFLSDRRGSTAIEYAMIAGLIALVLFTAVATIGDSLVAMFDSANAGFGAN
jgi:pilus assembly protein Flp/PilA